MYVKLFFLTLRLDKEPVSGKPVKHCNLLHRQFPGYSGFSLASNTLLSGVAQDRPVFPAIFPADAPIQSPVFASDRGSANPYATLWPSGLSVYC